MADVPGMQQEVRRRGWRVGLVCGGLQRSHHIWIGGLVEAHVAVADLNKAEICPPAGMFRNIFGEGPGDGKCAPHSPYQTGPSPSHAFEKSAPVDAVVVEIL